MRILKGRKNPGANQKEQKKDIFEVKEKARDVDHLEVEIVQSPTDNNFSSKTEILLSSVSEKLVAEGFEKVEIVALEEPFVKTPKKASPEDIESLIRETTKRKKESSEATVSQIDLTEKIDNKKLEKLANFGEVDRENDEESELIFVKSAKVELKQKNIVESDFKSIQAQQNDSQLILETRFGKQKGLLENQRKDEIAFSPLDSKSGEPLGLPNNREKFDIGDEKNEKDVEADKVPEIVRIIRSKNTNKGNRRKPFISKKANIREGLQNGSQVKPLIKSVRKKKRNRVNTKQIKVDLPKASNNLLVKTTNRKTGKVLFKPIRPRREPLIPLYKTLPFKKDNYLPKINVAPVGNDEVIVQIGDIHPRYQKIDVYRREISSRPFEDEYQLLQTIQDPPKEYSFLDAQENARAFKYVCVGNDEPLYSFTTYTNKNYVFDKMIEPFAYAYQVGTRVVIRLLDLPSHCKKLMVMRKSSVEDEEILVEAFSLFGSRLRSRQLQIIDNPLPVEQSITYRFLWIDEDGIENTFDEKPEVNFTTTRRGTGTDAELRRLTVNFDKKQKTVQIKAEATIDNLFVAQSDAEIKNPTENTLKAAARGLVIAKFQLRRINLKTQEDEIILKEIINPGLSKFDTQLKALNRLTVEFSDTPENAETFGYTPLIDRSQYVYIGRIIVYPVGLELRKVSDFTTIDGLRGPGRLRYKFDPGIFDHPLNTELGILPSKTDARSYAEADLIGLTEAAISRQVYVSDVDTEDAIELSAVVRRDSAFDPVVQLTGTVPRGLLDDLDHIKIVLSYDTVKKKDVIDRIYLRTGNFVYYDYAFDDLACNKVSYSIIGIGKDFETLFESAEISIDQNDPKLTRFNRQRDSLGDKLKRAKIEEKKANRRKSRKPRKSQR